MSKEVLRFSNISCRLPSMNLSQPVCGKMEEVIILTVAYRGYTTIGTLPNCSCQPPCQLIRYSVEVQPSEKIESGEDVVTQIRIYFVEKTAEVLTERQAYDFIQAVGEFGGCLGMFLGISLVSLYEFLDWYIRIGFARFVSGRQ